MIDNARLVATKKQSRSTDVETFPSSPPKVTRQVVASSLLNSSPRCRLPLDGVVLNALHSVDKEFVNKGTLRTFKASDDEKFQISSNHFNQFCTPPHLDENAEEGLTSCNVQQCQNKNFGSTFS